MSLDTQGKANVATGRRRVEPAVRPVRRDDTGSETIEIVVILPALMALVVAILQLAMWALAAHALSLAVAEGGAIARSPLGAGAGDATVHSDVDSIAGSLVGSLSVKVQSLPGQYVSVTATGTVPTVLPGVVIHVSSTSVGPAEHFRASG